MPMPMPMDQGRHARGVLIGGPVCKSHLRSETSKMTFTASS